MFFDDPSAIPQIAKVTGFSIFIVKNTTDIDSLIFKKSFGKTATFISPNEKGVITVDQIRELEDLTKSKETSDRFIVVNHAESLNLAAENAALKLLEEPGEHFHLVFLASDLSALLPTVRSRAALYVLRTECPLDTPPAVDEKIKNLAKQLIVATPRTAKPLIDNLTDKKRKNPRKDALEVIAVAIELLYKSYFKTKNPALLKKLPPLIKLYDNLKGNGHLKLQLYAALA